jgi:hypothetical protein
MVEVIAMSSDAQPAIKKIIETGATQPPVFPEGFTPPASKPYIYNSTTNTYTPVG